MKRETAFAMSNHERLEQAIVQRKVTHDFERRIEGAIALSGSGFGDVIIENNNHS
jgi:isocitrate dehydrogenase